jgi:hypothetical protein
MDEAAYPVLVKCFSAAERERLIAEDMMAGRSVSLELTVVLLLGLFLGMLSVLFSL